MSRDRNHDEWTLGWGDAGWATIEDGPREFEDDEYVKVVPKSRLEAAEAELDRLREVLREIIRLDNHRPNSSISFIARAALSEPLDKEEG